MILDDGSVIRRPCQNWEEVLNEAGKAGEDFADWDHIVTKDEFSDDGLVTSFVKITPTG